MMQFLGLQRAKVNDTGRRYFGDSIKYKKLFLYIVLLVVSRDGHSTQDSQSHFGEAIGQEAAPDVSARSFSCGLALWIFIFFACRVGVALRLVGWGRHRGEGR
jgi:hypothetical protein